MSGDRRRDCERDPGFRGNPTIEADVLLESGVMGGGSSLRRVNR